jgi:ADP-L-glycero-D-manno-heptose 6-epimerase
MASVILHAFDQIRADGEVRLFKSYRPEVADGEQRRDFVFVEDVVEVLHFALATPLARGIFNLGTGTSRTFLDLAHATFAALGAPPRIRFIEMPEPLRARYQYATEATMGRLRSAGYARPFTTLEDGARRYVQRLLAVAAS